MSARHSSARRTVLRLAIAASASAIGCGYTEIHDAVLRPTGGPSQARVEIYVGEQAPSRAFYEVALLEVFGYGSDAEIEDMAAALEARGRALGCDALLRTRFDLGRSMAHGYGVCVKWAATSGAAVTTPAPTPAPAPASAPAEL